MPFNFKYLTNFLLVFFIIIVFNIHVLNNPHTSDVWKTNITIKKNRNYQFSLIYEHKKEKEWWKSNYQPV